MAAIFFQNPPQRVTDIYICIFPKSCECILMPTYVDNDEDIFRQSGFSRARIAAGFLFNGAADAGVGAPTMNA